MPSFLPLLRDKSPLWRLWENFAAGRLKEDSTSSPTREAGGQHQGKFFWQQPTPLSRPALKLGGRRCPPPTVGPTGGGPAQTRLPHSRLILKPLQAGGVTTVGCPEIPSP